MQQNMMVCGAEVDVVVLAEGSRAKHSCKRASTILAFTMHTFSAKDTFGLS